MPAYNCEQYITQAIDSILNQTYSNFELIIADDCSTDNTKQIIDSYSDIRIKRYHNSTNLGYLQASNKLIKEATGDFITFQDADDYCHLSRLEKQISFLNKNMEVDCVGTNIIKVDALGNQLYNTNYPLENITIKTEFENFKAVMTGSSLMVSRKVIEEIGLYHTYFNRVGNEDIYWFSLILKKFKVANISDALYYYRTNPTSITSTHTHSKALVGHELILKMYFRTLKYKVDYIAKGAINKVNAYTDFLIIFNQKPKNKFKFTLVFMGCFFKHPIVSVEFFRTFISRLIRT